MDAAKLTVEQLKKLAQSERQKANHAKAELMKIRKNADGFSKSAKAVADISKANPEL
jgi:DNA-directed RNA polymerase subunit F